MNFTKGKCVYRNYINTYFAIRNMSIEFYELRKYIQIKLMDVSKLISSKNQVKSSPLIELHSSEIFNYKPNIQSHLEHQIGKMIVE